MITHKTPFLKKDGVFIFKFYRRKNIAAALDFYGRVKMG